MVTSHAITRYKERIKNVTCKAAKKEMTMLLKDSHFLYKSSRKNRGDASCYYNKEKRIIFMLRDDAIITTYAAQFEYAKIANQLIIVNEKYQNEKHTNSNKSKKLLKESQVLIGQLKHINDLERKIYKIHRKGK